MKGFASPNHTQTPNELFDVYLPQIKDLSELKVTLAIIRQTLGYHKKKDQISLTRLQQLTGLSRQAAFDGAEKAVARGLVEIVGTGKRGATIYGLVFYDWSTEETSESIDWSTEETRTGLTNRLTKESIQKKSIKDTPALKSAEPAPRNEMYDAIHAVWKYTAGRNGQLAKMLQGTSTHKDYKAYNLAMPITPTELKQWATWYRRTEFKGNEEMSMVASPLKIQSSITYWQETQARRAPRPSTAPELDLNIQQPIVPMFIQRQQERSHE